MTVGTGPITAIDLFCGVGGLSLGLKQAKIQIAAGIDLDPACAYPYARNIDAPFIQQDIRDTTGAELNSRWGKNGLRLLAGCAPCQPFSSHRRGIDTSNEDNWDLLSQFERLTRETTPDFVTMENVTRIKNQPVFTQFVETLELLEYTVDFGILYGPDFDLPQERRRLVLMASRVGRITLPTPNPNNSHGNTVRTAIGNLPPLKSGETDPTDPLHSARNLSPQNLKRVRASKPGGTWNDWPEELRAPCHRKDSGQSFRSFYGRMAWDSPAPTITTQAYNFGTGRFGHPSQDRGITLREAAILQGFPPEYRFTPPGTKPSKQAVGRLIGNAVPPAFGKAIGSTFLKSISED